MKYHRETTHNNNSMRVERPDLKSKHSPVNHLLRVRSARMASPVLLVLLRPLLSRPRQRTASVPSGSRGCVGTQRGQGPAMGLFILSTSGPVASSLLLRLGGARLARRRVELLDAGVVLTRVVGKTALRPRWGNDGDLFSGVWSSEK